MDNKIALLRGINVGGKKKILMADLKELFIQLGCKQVKTYIQSGNVLFESIEDNSQLADQIKIAIQKKFDFDVPVDRKSTRLNSSHVRISYAVFCLKKKKKKIK